MNQALDNDLLRSFAAVLDAGGFSRAAERLNLTQSTVSQQIRKLETATGCTLLTRDRAGGGARPTEQGELLPGYARRILALAAEAREAIQTPTAPRTVRLAVPEDFADRRLIGLLSKWISNDEAEPTTAQMARTFSPQLIDQITAQSPAQNLLSLRSLPGRTSRDFARLAKKD
jgi:DNA-binding Lrp family transcriptional regulator